MANSDIIKIGFDYRASLAQFEKETNGVFDGISNKAGKQKITIQLDAKDDKVIDKIKELQKLKLDKFTFEFGNSGLKEQLQTFDKLENKINEIISLSKGIDLSFNTKNKTDAYNQLKKYADAFKDYYGNEEAMATNAGAKAGYAYYKAYEEALRKGVAQSKLEKVTIDFDVNDSFFSKERIVGNRIKEFENFQKYGNADESNLIAEITSLENRLLKFNSAYSQVKANLGDAPITSEITKNIEEYVRLLEVAESRAKDAELFGYSSEDINSDKDLANMYLDFAKEDATAENKKYIESLKQEETQAIATAEAEQKLAVAQKETVSNTSNSNNSQIEELKSDIQEVKTELGDVKDRISSIESNGFENVRDDVEKTKESVKELNSEFAEMKSNLSSTSQESNISLTSDSTVEQQIKSESELNAEIEKRENIIRELQQLQEKLTVHEDFHGNDRYFADQLPTEEEIREADKRIKQLTGTNNIFNVDKLIQDRNKWLSEVKYSLEEYDDLIKANDQKALDEYTTRGLSRIGGAESFFGYEDNNFSIASKFVEEKEKIQNEINDLYTDLDKLDEKMNLDSNNSSVDNTVQSQEKLQSELKETQKQAEKTAQAVKESTTASTEQKKDAFPKTSENLEQVAKSEQKVQQEAVATDKAFDNISFTPNTEGFEDIIAKFGILREQAEQITKIVKTTKQTAGGTPDISYKATLKNGSSYYLGENSTPQVLNASETVYDAKAVAKNAEQEAKAIQAEWDKNIKAIQDYMDAVTKLNNLKAKDKGTGSQANQIALQTQNIEKLKQVAFEARQNLSSMQAENPDIIAWKQWVDMMELFDQASKGSAESAAKLKDVLNNIKVPSLDKYENKLASYQTKKAGYDATIARFKDGGWTSDEYLKNVQAVKDAVKKYEDLLSNIKAKGGITSEEDVQKLKEYESEIKKTISTVTNMSAAEKGYNFVSAQKELDKIHKLLAENSKMSSEAKAKIQAYYREIESGNPSMSLDKIHGEILKIYNAEVEAGRAGRSFFDTLKNSGFHQLAAQMAGMFGVYDVINLGKQAFSTVKELDYALVDLKKTTAMNSSELEQFYYDSNDVAKQMGVTTKEIIDQASSWSRLGYNSKQAATEMAKLSSQFALISPGMDTTTSQEGLVSIMKAWDIGYQDVKSQIMDDINALGNAMAEDNQDIVEGMERSAAALAAVGTSTKDAFALFSGIQEVLQNSEKSGTSLRSVALRLRSFDETTGEYSEDLANITGELADLTKTAEHAQGVSVFKPGSTTEFKSLVDYFREIADIWDEMSQKQQNDFLLKAFGRTQAQAGAALIQNFKGVEKALDVMDNAAGSSDKEMETAKQSITYKLNELKQTWVGTVQDIANRDDLGKIVDGLIDLSSAIGFVIDKLGLVGTVGLFGGAGTGIFKFIKNFDWVFKPYTKTLSNSF